MERSSSTATSFSSSPSSQRGGGRELQGPRPAPLKVRKESHKIRKPPQPGPPVQVRQPVIIYTVSPKVVHAEPSEFMSVVQRLTGARTTASSSSFIPAAPTQQPPSLPFPFFGGHHVPSSSALLPPPAPQPQSQFPFQLQQQGPHDLSQLSPAARLADIQQASARTAGGVDAGGLPPLPSILSPVPGSLPAIPASFFSPPAGAGEAGGGINLFGELISPGFLGATTTSGGNINTAAAGASPNYPMLQQLPSPSGAYYYWDLFNYHHNL